MQLRHVLMYLGLLERVKTIHIPRDTLQHLLGTIEIRFTTSMLLWVRFQIHLNFRQPTDQVLANTRNSPRRRLLARWLNQFLGLSTARSQPGLPGSNLPSGGGRGDGRDHEGRDDQAVV